MPILLLDTNFFRNFVEQEDFFTKVNTHLATRYRGVEPRDMALFVSPFSFLEYLGITLEPPGLPDGIVGIQPIVTLEDATNMAESVFNHARLYFDQHPHLSASHLADTLRHREGFVRPRARGYWDIAIGRYSRAENRSILIHCLAIEFIQKLPLKRNQATTYHPYLWLDAAKRISEGMDVCMFRTIQWRWSNENRHQRIKQFGLSFVNRLYKAMGVRWKDDLVDAELIHYTTFGKLNAGSPNPVDSYTCDPNVKIKDRIGVFHAGLLKTISEVNQTVESLGREWNFKFPLPAPGTVTFFNAAGDLVEGPVCVTQLITRSDVIRAF